MSRLICLGVIIVLFGINRCRAIEIYQFVDARSYSMGNTLSILPGFANPAGNGFLSSRYCSLQYSNKYGVNELSTYAGIINVPNKYLDAGLYISRFGFDAYHETLIAGNIYKRLSEYIVLGIRVNYLNLYYSGKETSKSLVTGDIGLLIKPVEELNISLLAINPIRTKIKIGEENIEIPVILSFGVSYDINENFLITAEVEKDILYPAIYKFGMEYTPIKQLNIRAGIFGKPYTPSFGFGINLHPFNIDLAFNKHPVLGYHSCCGLQFNF